MNILLFLILFIGVLYKIVHDIHSHKIHKLCISITIPNVFIRLRNLLSQVGFYTKQCKNTTIASITLLRFVALSVWKLLVTVVEKEIVAF
jgi:hypothetical protein